MLDRTDRSPVSLLLLLASLLVGCNGSPPGSESAEGSSAESGSGGAAPRTELRSGTEEMVARLEAIRRDADPLRSIMKGDTQPRVEAARRRANQARRSNSLSAGVQATYRLADELLAAGDTEEAVQVLESLEALFVRMGSRLEPRSLNDARSRLAVAHLRRAEQDNCLARHGPDSCLLPLRGGGLHEAREGSSAAIEKLELVLASNPDRLDDLWLDNIAHMTLGQWPEGVPEAWRIPPEVFASEHDLPRFRNVGGRLGLDRRSLSGGAVLEDFDGDGRLDVMVSAWGLSDPLRYFRNVGDGRFEDRTAEAGLTGLFGGLNLIHADHDNDGDRDVLVLRGAWGRDQGRHPNSLLRNEGDGTFVDVTESAGLLSFHPTQTADWADFDLDGDLDLFIGNESTLGETHPCELYRNDGTGRFEDVAAEVGLDLVGFVKGASWGDFDGDGWPDLYLSCLGEPNRLLRNEARAGGGRRFVDVTAAAGVAEPLQSFPTWFFDYDNDGWEDLVVLPFAGFGANSLAEIAADRLGRPSRAERPRLYRNRGDGRFEELSREAGLDDAMLAMGSNFGDLDNDGFLDLYVGTGEPNFATLVPNRAHRNDGGRRFQDVTSAAGLGHLQKGHGIAFGDLDNDGDQDILAVMGGAYAADQAHDAVFLNPGVGHRWLTLLLEGTSSNRDGIGARIRVRVRTAEGPRDIRVTVGTGGSFGSSTLRQEIGLGRAEGIEEVEIRWPTRDSEPQVLRGLEPDRAWRVREGEASAQPVDLPRVEL